jgi:hypothetical protein
MRPWSFSTVRRSSVVAGYEPAGLRLEVDHDHCLMQCGLIGLRQHIIGPLRNDLSRKLGLTPDGIDGDDAPQQGEMPQQGRNLRALWVASYAARAMATG